jgi:hypothetical protein
MEQIKKLYDISRELTVGWKEAIYGARQPEHFGPDGVVAPDRHNDWTRLTTVGGWFSSRCASCGYADRTEPRTITDGVHYISELPEGDGEYTRYSADGHITGPYLDFAAAYHGLLRIDLLWDNARLQQLYVYDPAVLVELVLEHEVAVLGVLRPTLRGEIENCIQKMRGEHKAHSGED